MSDWKNVQYKDGKMRTSEGGGGGGASNFADLEDVSFNDIQNGQVPKYNSETQKWENANESGGGGHTYSTTEQVVDTWIDGNPIYEKTIEISSLSAGSTTTIQHNIANFGELINVHGEVNLANGEHRPMPMAYWDSNWAISIFEFTSTTFGVWLGSSYGGNRAFSKAYVIIQYTKTTD